MDVSGIVSYLAGFVIMAGIYAVFALGLNVHWGFTGLFNIGIAGFFALGAYTTALLTTQPPDLDLFEDFKFGGNWSGLPFLDLGIDLWFFLGLGAAAAVCGIIALLIGYVTLRLRDDYLAIATLGIAKTVRLLFLNEKWIANGSKGLYRIPSSGRVGWHRSTTTTSTWSWSWSFWRSSSWRWNERSSPPWGRVLRAIREDEIAAEASGKDVFAFKLKRSCWAPSSWASVGRSSPQCSASSHRSPSIRFCDLHHLGHADGGGAGNNLGAILGAFIVWGIWTGIQFLPGVFSDPNFRFFMIGVLIVAVILVRPGGILGEERRVARAGDT